jgi:hypothetical protein
MATLTRRFLKVCLPLVALVALCIGSLGCNLTSQHKPTTPTITFIAGTQEGLPELVLPTATPGPTDTLLGAQFDPLPTLAASPTNFALPTPIPPTASPTTTATATPNIASSGDLRITLLEFDDWQNLGDGRVQWTVLVHAVGGNGVYTYEHIGQVHDTPAFDVAGTRGSDVVHSITVRSADGQQVTCDYFIPGGTEGYFSYQCQ